MDHSAALQHFCAVLRHSQSSMWLPRTAYIQVQVLYQNLECAAYQAQHAARQTPSFLIAGCAEY